MRSNSKEIFIKREILIEIVRAFFSDDFGAAIRLIPYGMRPKGAQVPYRCCIYKERAIIRDRIIAGLGFSTEDSDDTISLTSHAENALHREKPEQEVLTVIDTACKGCEPSKVFVTDACQGCVARSCQAVCKFGAVSIINGKSVIDQSKCKKCKICITACPYNAIIKTTVPCEMACPVGAIAKHSGNLARIDFNKCISCGKCITVCPFGAVHEKSQLIEVLKQLKSDAKVIAMVAPSLVGQFPGTIHQLKGALLKAGFSDVYEVAQGADITIKNEAHEFDERMANQGPFMTTSCCAGYNQLVEKHLPEMKSFISTTKTPLYYIAQLLRERFPTAILVFISPCVAKRKEVNDNVAIDYLMTFEELGALLVGRGIEIMDCESSTFTRESSKQGRGFGVTGGVAAAVATLTNTPAKPKIINGLNKDTIRELAAYANNGTCPGCNLVEIMCCEFGCIGGNATISPPKMASKSIKEFGSTSKDIDTEE